MYYMRFTVSIWIIVSFCFFYNAGCKKAEAPADRTVERTYIQKPGLTGKNIRKNGFVSIQVDDTENSKNKIKEYADEYNAQIIEENISVNSDKSLILSYRIKVKSENFSFLIEKISGLGTLLGMHVQSEDVTDEMAQQSDKIDLLASRLNSAKAGKDAKLIDKLQERLHQAKKEKEDTHKAVMYSYLNITLHEATKVSHAFSLGFYYGKEGFVWMIKAVIVVIIAGIPALIAFLFLKLIIALSRWQWKRLVLLVENIGKGKGAK